MIYLLVFFIFFIFFFLISRILIKSISHMFLRVTGSTRLTITFLHLLFLPGVIIHELSHIITAKALLVKTKGLTFIPELEGDNIIMGSVEIHKTDQIRRSIIGFAPVFVGFLIIGFLIFYFLTDRSPFSQPSSYLLTFFIVFEIGNTMFSSRRDLEGTVKLLIVLVLVAFAAYFMGFRLPQWLISFFNSNQFFDTMEKGIWILILPIALDLILIGFIRIFLWFRNSPRRLIGN